MRSLLISLLLLQPMFSYAATNPEINSKPEESIHGIVNEVLNIISGEKGKVRDWDAYRNLFLPTVRFTVLYHSDDPELQYESVTLEEFIEMMQDAYYENGFTEYEIGKRVDEYNGIAQVFQAYEGKDSEGYEERGMTSYQLLKFNGRWWIANVIWTGDSNGVEIPAKYLNTK